MEALTNASNTPDNASCVQEVGMSHLRYEIFRTSKQLCTRYSLSYIAAFKLWPAFQHDEFDDCYKFSQCCLLRGSLTRLSSIIYIDADHVVICSCLKKHAVMYIETVTYTSHLDILYSGLQHRTEKSVEFSQWRWCRRPLASGLVECKVKDRGKI